MFRLTKQITLGGITAALAVVIMCLVGMLGIATYVCPVLCMVLLSVLIKLCSNKICWCWYIVVSILSLLLAPDKEAAAVFLFLGYYPILRPWLSQRKFPLLWKALLFNGTMIVLYSILLYVIGLESLTSELQEIGAMVLLVLGNITFFFLDVVLGKVRIRR